MRDDLAQLLVETPRHNTGEFYRMYRRRAKQNLDLAPTKQGMRRPYYERKQFGEYFKPLKGLLHKNVGRPWDKVFSEINSALHGGGTVIEHTKMHLLRDFITLKPYWIGNKPHHLPMWGHGYVPLNNVYYVDRQGVLRHAKAVHRKLPIPVVKHVKIDDSTAFHKIDGIWYRIWTKLLPVPDQAHPPVFDIVLKKWVHCEGRKLSFLKGPASEVVRYRWSVVGSYDTRELDSLHGANRVAYRRESVSSRTIRREGLNKIK